MLFFRQSLSKINDNDIIVSHTGLNKPSPHASGIKSTWKMSVNKWAGLLDHLFVGHRLQKFTTYCYSSETNLSVHRDASVYHWSGSSLVIISLLFGFDIVWANCACQCLKMGKLLTYPTSKLLLSFGIIPDVYRSLIPNKITLTKYFLTQWISKLLRSFAIHRERQYLLNFTGLAGIVNAIVYNCPSFQHWHAVDYTPNRGRRLQCRLSPTNCGSGNLNHAISIYLYKHLCL